MLRPPELSELRRKPPTGLNYRATYKVIFYLISQQLAESLTLQSVLGINQSGKRNIIIQPIRLYNQSEDNYESSFTRLEELTYLFVYVLILFFSVANARKL